MMISRVFRSYPTIILIMATSFCPAFLFAQESLITFDDIKKISPSAKDDLARGLVEAPDEFENAGINTRLRAAHFIAQVMTETGGLNRLDENLNYSKETLLRVFSRRTISEAKALEIARKPKEVGNWVYGERLGNLGRHTDDGWNYRGSGYLQLTGRSNFRERGKEVGLPLEENPELARRPKEGRRVALAYWSARNINASADANDRRRVRMLVNGPAAHGYEQSVYWFNRAWKLVFRDKAAAGFENAEMLAEIESIDEEALFNQMLVESGVLPSVAVEADVRESSIEAFQHELGLPETGVLDEATRNALLDPREWRYQDDDMEQVSSITGSDPNGSVVITFAPAVSDELALTSSEGTGVTLANPSMPLEIQREYESASAIYPDYETGRTDVPPGWYIPFSVIGDDERTIIVDTTTFPERAIVQILFNDGFGGAGLCSGAMVSPDTVLTAGHCIHTGTFKGKTYSDFRVIPGRNVGATPFGICGVRSAYLLRGWTEAANELDARYYDLGALKLDCMVGEKTGWFGVRPISSSDQSLPTLVQGYAADRAPPGRQWVSKDTLRILGDLKGFYQNDTYGGTSGAPVFIGTDRDFLSGVHTNGIHGQEEPWASNNAFTAITPERILEIRRWISSE